MTLRVISLGGGVQSTALAVLAAQERIDFPTALFANVGDDSEHPDTLAYVRTVLRPWLADRAVEVVELDRRPKRGRFAGETETIWKRITHPDSRSVGIPVRMDGSGAPATRQCTVEFKIRTVERWLKEHGASADDPATVAIGFSTDEFHRANPSRAPDCERVVYPLLDLGLSRGDCAALIEEAGLPVPPKSACFFCPMSSPRRWAELRRDRPDLFAKAVELEERMNETRRCIGKDPVWLTSALCPLDEAIPEAQPSLFSVDWTEDASCDSGYCFV